MVPLQGRRDWNSRPALALVLTTNRNAKHDGRTMPQVQDNRIVETRTEARQGETGHNVRFVLGAGVIAVVVLFAIVYIAFFH